MSRDNESHQIVRPSCGAVNRELAAQMTDRPSCGRCKQPLFPGNPVILDARNFDKQITRNDIPVVVDFWAPWCGPCQVMAPGFAQAAAELEPGVRLAKLNTEEAQSIAARHDIRSIPTLVMFRNGREIARQTGAMQRVQLVQWVRNHAGYRRGSFRRDHASGADVETGAGLRKQGSGVSSQSNRSFDTRLTS